MNKIYKITFAILSVIIIVFGIYYFFIYDDWGQFVKDLEKDYDKKYGVTFEYFEIVEEIDDRHFMYGWNYQNETFLTYFDMERINDCKQYYRKDKNGEEYLIARPVYYNINGNKIENNYCSSFPNDYFILKKGNFIAYMVYDQLDNKLLLVNDVEYEVPYTLYSVDFDIDTKGYPVFGFYNEYKNGIRGNNYNIFKDNKVILKFDDTKSHGNFFIIDDNIYFYSENIFNETLYLYDENKSLIFNMNLTRKHNFYYLKNVLKYLILNNFKIDNISDLSTITGIYEYPSNNTIIFTIENNTVYYRIYKDKKFLSKNIYDDDIYPVLIYNNILYEYKYHDDLKVSLIVDGDEIDEKFDVTLGPFIYNDEVVFNIIKNNNTYPLRLKNNYK